MTSSYMALHILLIYRLFLSRKLTGKKVLNFVLAKVSRILRLKAPLNTPVAVNIELWNECNEACVFCRSSSGLIYRGDGDSGKTSVPKGHSETENVVSIIEAFAEKALVFIPYVNGEPLIARNLDKVLGLMKAHKVGSVIASNGISLDKKRRDTLINNDVNLVKVHISGMTNEVHQIEHRQGNVARILRNLESLSCEARAQKSRMIIMLDYILYNHNQHQVSEAKKFCSDHKIFFNIRPGIADGLVGEDSNEPLRDVAQLPCDWVWEAMTVDWDGAMLPCCDFVLWRDDFDTSQEKPLSVADLRTFWFSGKMAGFRESLITKGRAHNRACAGCKKVKLGFKY